MLMVYLLSHGGVHGIIPDALQIRRLAAGTRTGDQQIAGELKIQRGELRIVAFGEMS